jgi:hypothetical protein
VEARPPASRVSSRKIGGDLKVHLVAGVLEAHVGHADHEVGEGLAAGVVDIVGEGLPGREADVAAGVKGEAGAAKVKRGLA